MSKSRVLAVLFLLILLAAAAGAWYLKPRFESEPPQVALSPDTDVLNATTGVDIVVTDPGSGLRYVSAIVVMGGVEHSLVREEYARPVREKRIPLATARIPGLKEGPVTIRIHARDDSFSHAFKGNETLVEKQLTVDVSPPVVELVADDRYVNFGGVGALVYKASEDTVKSGVKVGERFFPGFKGVVKGHPEQYFAFFAHPYDAPADARPSLIATDKAGNTKEMRLAYELKGHKYRKSTIALSDAFLENKVAPLLTDVAARQAGPKEMFVAVNKKVRKENEDKIAAVTSKATPKPLWTGAFSQLSNSKVEANFADQRTYTFKGETLDTAYHLGYDLSVTKHYPVEVANAGTVAFTGDLGLYGNTVIVDHGLGLFTLYGHLSSIDVKQGDAVEKRQVIGKTGETGFAGGDHLHYGVYLDGVAVLPVEWWDAKWINDNVAPKLDGRTANAASAPSPSSRRPPPPRVAEHRASPRPSSRPRPRS
ncbi:MAG TPA: M23 family metallopeptidase [Usitatibacter sp.]|nr:M23 family metallopeptidase [Usitatibacter sp.]